MIDARGAESKDGPTDRRLAAGADVTLFIPDKAKTVKEVRIGVPKAAAQSRPERHAEGRPQDRRRRARPRRPEGARRTSRRLTAPTWRKVLRVSREGDERQRSCQWTWTRARRWSRSKAGRTTLTIGDDVVFYGPLGGVSDRKIKDDRFAAGSEIVIVYNTGGRTVKEIHLPYRQTADEDKGKGKASDKKKGETVRRHSLRGGGRVHWRWPGRPPCYRGIVGYMNTKQTSIRRLRSVTTKTSATSRRRSWPSTLADTSPAAATGRQSWPVEES